MWTGARREASGGQGLRAPAPAQGISSLDPFCGSSMVGLLRMMGGAAAGRRRGGAVRALREGAAGAQMLHIVLNGCRWGPEALQLCRWTNSHLHVQRLSECFRAIYAHAKQRSPSRFADTHTARNNPSSPPHAHPQPLTAAAQAPRDKCGDFAEGCFRCKRKFRQPSATGAAPIAAAIPTATEREGVRGKATRIWLSPGGFPPLSTRESGLPAAIPILLQPNGNTHHSTSNSTQQKKQQATK